MRRRIAAVVLGLGLWPGGARAAAEQPAPVRLRWDAPADCPSQVEVEARLEKALAGYEVVPSVEASIEGEPGALRGQVVLRGPWGETTRQLDSRSCDTLADAVVLLASVSAREHEQASRPSVPEPEPVEALDGGDLAVEVEREDAAPPAVDDALVPLVEEPLVTDDEPSRGLASSSGATTPQERPFELLARLELRAGAPVLPQIDAAAGLALGIAGRWLRLEASAAGWLPRREPIAPGAELDVRLWAGELRGCATGPLPRTSWLRPMGCVGLEVGGLRGEGRGEGLASSDVAVRTWVAGVATAGVVIRPWRHLGVALGGSLVVPMRDIRFTLRGAGEVYASPSVAGRGFAGLEVYLP